MSSSINSEQSKTTEQAGADLQTAVDYISELETQRDELLAACKTMLEAYAPKRDENDRVHLHSSVLAAIDAIAKVEGKQ